MSTTERPYTKEADVPSVGIVYCEKRINFFSLQDATNSLSGNNTAAQRRHARCCWCLMVKNSCMEH